MSLFLQVAASVSPVFVIAAIGYVWVRAGWNFDVEFVTRLAMTLSVPCLIFMALMRSNVDPAVLRATVLAALVAYVLLGLVAWFGLRLLGLDLATYWGPVTFGNTGNLGLPVALFAFGQAGFDLAVIVFAVMAILSFTFGVWVVAGGGPPSRAFREPLVWGTILGSLFLAMGWHVPVWLGNSLDLVGQMAIPLMLLTLGVAISRLRPRSLGLAFWVSLAKLALCLAVPLAVGLAFGLGRLPLGVLVLQLSTPVAVTSYMLAAKYDARPDEVAGLVVVSTLMSVVAIPATLYFFV
ncbi:AEC family transporter [Amaricoccus solimangrovi]|uniref:AEC family transporter n=1 Tax=Amaricoccus solimangrovi TaxID=2589815 RepID=A0A501WTJ0_9RHOB|nr:AEC family transporter [Amaricoccus solimangrovi]TPE52718.1 AEC family transporter [Amaricoccus solimangrovi]